MIRVPNEEQITRVVKVAKYERTSNTPVSRQAGWADFIKGDRRRNLNIFLRVVRVVRMVRGRGKGGNGARARIKNASTPTHTSINEYEYKISIYGACTSIDCEQPITYIYKLILTQDNYLEGW